jgi:hypothetical protein
MEFFRELSDRPDNHCSLEMGYLGNFKPICFFLWMSSCVKLSEVLKATTEPGRE